LDANTLIYHFSQHPRYGAACTELLERIPLQDLVGHTSIHVLGEAAHRLMALEAIDRFGWPNTGVANRPRRVPCPPLCVGMAHGASGCSVRIFPAGVITTQDGQS